MKRDHEDPDLIDLGTVTRATKGAAGATDDSQGGHRIMPGLADD